LLASRERVSRERELDVTLPPIYVGNVTFNFADRRVGRWLSLLLSALFADNSKSKARTSSRSRPDIGL
jgi:hypothetical protein